MHSQLLAITERIRQRSSSPRAAYLERCDNMRCSGPNRDQLACSNFAHGIAACPAGETTALKLMEAANVALVSAYNDMLSAHQPLQRFPAIVKQAAHERGCTAQFAGGVPAMCDGAMLTLDATKGILQLQLNDSEMQQRDCATWSGGTPDLGRVLFGCMRNSVNAAEQDATVFDWSPAESR